MAELEEDRNTQLLLQIMEKKTVHTTSGVAQWESWDRQKKGNFGEGA